MFASAHQFSFQAPSSTPQSCSRKQPTANFFCTNYSPDQQHLPWQDLEPFEPDLPPLAPLPCGIRVGQPRLEFQKCPSQPVCAPYEGEFQADRLEPPFRVVPDLCGLIPQAES
ncbi:hypothetical protein ACFX2J_028058 [Malus domestica]